jgi:hypothetical protein
MVYFVMQRMQTSVSGEPSAWTADIWRKWNAVTAEPTMPEGKVTSANYFTPRPYVNEYDRGSDKEGFVYTIAYRHVWSVTNLDG